MVLGPASLVLNASLVCGLAVLISAHSTGLVLAWRDGYGSAARGSGGDRPPMPMDAEENPGYRQPSTSSYLDFAKRKSTKPHQPTAYDLLQHALWDKKMSDESDDVNNYDSRKGKLIQDRLNDDYIKRTIEYLMDGIEEASDEQRRVGGYGDEGGAIAIQRRSRLPETCGNDGHMDYSVTKRVVLGREVAEGRWPWLVQLAVVDAKQPYCGGTLLNGQFVLTAAHCFDRHEPNDVVVILGDRDRSRKEGMEQRFRIDCVYVHKEYIPKGDYKDDIALIRLKTERETVKMGPGVQPACLPPRQRPGDTELFKAGDKCFVVGWGFTDPLTYFNSEHPDVLHEARLPILSPKSCRDAYGDLYTDKMVCAGHMTGGERTDACKGDSGGPLMCRNMSGQWVVWGVVSWGHNYFCNGSPDKPIPTVYTKVEKYLPWMYKKLRLRQC